MNLKLNQKYTKTALMLCLLLLLTSHAKLSAQENPLSTIGEQPLNNSDNLSSPFKSGNSSFKPDGKLLGQPQPQPEQTSPFNLSSPPETTETTPTTTPETTPKPANSKPEQAKGPKIEEMKTNGQGGPTESLLTNPANPVGLAYPYKELEKSLELLKKNDIAGAKKIVMPLTESLTELTEYHILLFKKLNDIETAKNQAQVEKKLALNFALLRDKAYYQLGLIYLEEKDYKKCVKYLVDLIKSQPNSELGMKAYEILQQIGFTEKIRLTP